MRYVYGSTTLPPFKPGNVELQELQAQAPIEFYVLQSIRNPDPKAFGNIATVRRAKIMNAIGYLYVWTYAQYWARITSTQGSPLAHTALYMDKESALSALVLWKLQTGLPVLIDDLLL